LSDSGRSTETQTTRVLSSVAASSLNFRTDALHTPVSMVGKTLSTTRLPWRSSEVKSLKSRPAKVNDGAGAPTSGSSPTVWTSLPRRRVVAMDSV
jgi:hypothetical protein